MWPKASASHLKMWLARFQAPISSDGAPASMMAAMKPLVKTNPSLLLLTRYKHCSDGGSEENGACCSSDFCTLQCTWMYSNPCNQSVVIRPHPAAGRAGGAFRSRGTQHPDGAQVHIAKAGVVNGRCRETTGNLCHRTYGVWSLLQCHRCLTVTWDKLSNLSAARPHYRTVPLQRDGWRDQGWRDQVVNWQTLF